MKSFADDLAAMVGGSANGRGGQHPEQLTPMNDEELGMF
jgi:hypothetical protein